MDRITRRWLEDAGACRPLLLDAVGLEFGGEIEVTRAVVVRATSLGIPVLWPGVRLATSAQQRRFLAFVVTLRQPMIRTIIGAALPAGRQAREQRASELRAAAGGEANAARNGARVLADLARDEAIADPSARDVDLAIIATLRAASYADPANEAAQDPPRAAMAEALMNELGLS